MGNNQELLVRRVFDEMASSEFEEYRSPNCILEVTIHKVCYPITESILRQIFGQFGKVEDVYVCMGIEGAEANVVFRSKLEAAEAFGELHGRHIYDGCCQMEIKWGCSNISKCLPAQATADLFPSTAPAFTSPSAIPVVASTTAQHIVVKDNAATRCLSPVLAPTLVPVTTAEATTTSSTSPPTISPTGSFPAPVAQGADEDDTTILNDPPTKCIDRKVFVTNSTQVFPVDTECIDRLSFLPIALLDDIISRLPIKDAARTALLSRRWRLVWCIVPLVPVHTHILSIDEDNITTSITLTQCSSVAPASTLNNLHTRNTFWAFQYLFF
ncbi:unnamed protein product [Urochloa humidicola]